LNSIWFGLATPKQVVWGKLVVFSLFVVLNWTIAKNSSTAKYPQLQMSRVAALASAH